MSKSILIKEKPIQFSERDNNINIESCQLARQLF